MSVQMKRGVFLKRIALFVLVIFLSVSAAGLMLWESAAYGRATRRQLAIQEHTARLLIFAARLRAQCDVALASPDLAPVTVRARIGELVEEAQRDHDDLTRILRRLEPSSRRRKMERSWADIKKMAHRLDTLSGQDKALLAEFGEEAEIFESAVLALEGESLAVTAEAAADARRIMWLACASLAVTVLLGGYGALAALSDAMNEVLADIALDQELPRMEDDAAFQRRMGKLSSAPADGRWRLSLQRVLHVHATHVTFEAVARRGEESILLWGKCYRWTGMVKGLQRLLWPAYGEATWRALNVMHHHGLGSPFPVCRRRVRRRPFTVGMLLLTQHVGAAEPLRQFLAGSFEMLAPEARLAFLRRFVKFWNALHDAGIRGMSLRYFHATGIEERAPESMKFFLFDLDQVWVGQAGRGWAHRFWARRDNRKLYGRLWPILTPVEREELRATMKV